MRKENIFRFPDETVEAKAKAVEILTTKLQVATLENKQILLLMSGGTWIEIMNQIDPQKIVMDKLAKLITLTSLDDRVTIGDDNNYKKITESSEFVKTLLSKGAKTISTIPKNNNVSVQEFGTQINTKFEEWFRDNPNGYVLATVGVGGIDNVEGHTAGIAPSSDEENFNKLFVDTNSLYVGYESTLIPSQRVTATFRLLTMADKIVLILGKEKKAGVLRKILEGKASLNEVPAVFFRQDEKTVMITDIPKQ